MLLQRMLLDLKILSDAECIAKDVEEAFVKHVDRFGSGKNDYFITDTRNNIPTL
jgi:hypothetical protein